MHTILTVVYPMSSLLLYIIVSTYTHTLSYLKTFGLGLALPFFLKEGDALRSYESRTPSRAAGARQPQAAFTGRERKARSPTLLSCAKAGAWEPSGRLPAGRAWRWGLTDLPTTALSPLGEEEGELPTSTHRADPLEHPCQPAATAATRQGRNTQMLMVHRLKRLRNHRLRSTVINTGTHKIQDREGCRNNVFLSKVCTQTPSPAFEKDPSGRRAQLRKTGPWSMRMQDWQNTDHTPLQSPSLQLIDPLRIFKQIMNVGEKTVQHSEAIIHRHETHSSFLSPFNSAATWRQ